MYKTFVLTYVHLTRKTLAWEKETHEQGEEENSITLSVSKDKTDLAMILLQEWWIKYKNVIGPLHL